MKSKTLKRVIELLIICLLLTLYAFLIKDVIVLSGNKILSIAICFVGFIATIFLSSLFHELGHLVFALFSGLKIYSFTVLFFKLEFRTKKLPKIRLVFPNNFGDLELLPKKAENFSRKVFVSTLGGAIFSLIYLAFGITMLYVGSYYAYCIFGITFPITAYIILVNVIPFSENSDGGLLFNMLAGGKLKKVIENSLNATANVILGVEPKDLDSRLLAEFTQECDIYSVRIIYLRYLAYFRRDGERAIKELITVCDSERLDEYFYATIFKELFYNAVINKDDAYVKANCEEAVNYLSYESHPSDYRIHAVYRLYTNEVEWAKLIVNEGEKKLPNFAEKGIVKQELECLKDIKLQFN